MSESFLSHSRLTRLLVIGLSMLLLLSATGFVTAYCYTVLHFVHTSQSLMLIAATLLCMYITFRNALGAIFAPAYASKRKRS